jgi:uncharacterized protein
LILVDTNILMYAVGADHPHKNPSLDFLQKVADGRVEATIDAEVLQEILHRYRSLRRFDEALSVCQLARDLFPDVLPITGAVMDQAQIILSKSRTMMTRDAVHAAVVMVHDMDAICSYDEHFDQIDVVRRVTP